MTNSSSNSRWIRVTDSRSRANRSFWSGQSTPTGISFSDSPVPTPRMTRPGARQPSVANACATTAGLYRKVGVRTLVPSVTRSVAWAAAPSQTRAFGAWPPVCRHGWKWSLVQTESKPARSAATARSSSRRGGNCSAEAL